MHLLGDFDTSQLKLPLFLQVVLHHIIIASPFTALFPLLHMVDSDFEQLSVITRMLLAHLQDIELFALRYLRRVYIL